MKTIIKYFLVLLSIISLAPLAVFAMGSETYKINSDVIGAGYMPYTGGTSNVDLGIHNLTVDTNSLFVDSVNHRVGIGTTTPGYKLDVAGDVNISGTFRVNGTAIAAGNGGGQLTKVTTLTSGSGTFTLQASDSYIVVKMVGAGGGGAGSGGPSGAGQVNAGGGGSSTIFGSDLTAGGGAGGIANNGGGGGTASLGSITSGVASVGMNGDPMVAAYNTAYLYLGYSVGGASVLGGGYGAGGNSAGTGSTAVCVGGAGGSGGYVEAFISSPSSSYSYTVGVGGTGGTAGASGYAGYAGKAGVVIIYEYTTGISNGSLASGTAGQIPYYNAAGTNLSATSSLFIADNSNVGIGTTSPGTKLEIAGVSTSGNTAGLSIYDTNTSGTGGHGIGFYNDYSDSASRNWGISQGSIAFGDFSIVQSTAKAGNPFSAGTSRFYIKNDGNVGIGTTGPGQKLDVVGGSIRTDNQFISTLATGTSPFAVTSTTLNTNLNADLLDGNHASYFQIAGSYLTTETDPVVKAINGLVKSNGTTIAAATAGTDYSAGTNALGTGILKSTTTTGALTIAVAGDFPTLNQNTTGSAATLTTARTINEVSFNGSANITVAADAGTLTGSTLAAGVTSSSLTSVGTLTGLTMGGNIVLGANTITTSNTTVVTNLNADLLDGHDGSYYMSATGFIPYTGGTSNVDLGIHNLTVDTNSLFVDSVNHRVGIGTASPGVKLEVAGQVTATQFNGALNGSVAWTNVSGRPSTGLVNMVDTAANSMSSAWSMPWKNYANHMIIDMSNGTAPNGTGHNNTNSEVAWAGTYPTLMGWNGSNTYGVRVDSARLADSAGNADTVDGLHIASLASPRGEGRNFIDYARYVYNNGAYSGSGWIEPSDLGVRYANSSNSTNYTNTAGLYYQGGNVGIATTNPLSRLSVGNPGRWDTNIFTAGNGVGVWGVGASYGIVGEGPNVGVEGIGGNADFWAAGAGLDYGTASSIRWKTNITEITGALEDVMKLQGVYYDIDEAHGGGHQIGFIGEEIGKYYPEIVSFDAESTDPSYYITGMDYSKMTPVLLQAIKEQQVEIVGSNNQISDLTLKTDADITNLQQLQSSIDTQLGVIGTSLTTLNTNSTTLQSQAADHETRITTLENLTATLKQQIIDLQNSIATPLDVAQLALNTQSIDYLNQLLGITPDSVAGDIAIAGKLTSKTTETGQLIIAVNDVNSATIGEATIPAGETAVTVSTTAVNTGSKVYITPIGSTDNQVVYVKTINASQDFEVGVDRLGTILIPKEIRFNWWVVEQK